MHSGAQHQYYTGRFASSGADRGGEDAAVNGEQPRVVELRKVVLGCRPTGHFRISHFVKTGLHCRYCRDQ
jgi:hypothetical protein